MVSQGHREINVEFRRSLPPKSEQQRKQDLLTRLRQRAAMRTGPNSWALEVYGEGIRVGGYASRDKAIGAAWYLRKNFPEYRWKLILHSPNGDVWIPRRGRVANEIIYQCAGHISRLKS
jgi:hypothetical protein